jgi:hypothetical protein
MLNNGHLPSAVALRLYEEFGVQIDDPGAKEEASRDEDVLHFFAGLVIPKDAIPVPSIFDDGGRA